MKFLITGGAGFIGSALIRHMINNTSHSILNIDKLTYASNLDALKSIESNSHYSFRQLDICDENAMESAYNEFQPDAVMHLAAESHVDQSISHPKKFIESNILGTYIMLETSRKYWDNLSGSKKDKFRFQHISTDEVFGDLEGTNDFFTESTPYAPSSPYSASKASADHLVRAWHRTYGLPVMITNCSNNYGPYQYPEKLIPLVIKNALAGKELPVYGDGLQVRDWLFLDDHAEALLIVAQDGAIGETYNIGGNNERTNIEVVRIICKTLNKISSLPLASGINNFEELITFVKDRPGHDVRYAIDCTKIKEHLGWEPKETFESGMEKTIQWFVDNGNDI